jgi:DNA repair exonuclease SbcCD ATPase subunit
MIRFGVAEIEHFLTIKKCSIDFSSPGLYGVLGPNGAGKSSLFLETLLYPLFGITERYGVNRDAIVNRFIGKDCHIHLPLSVEEVPAEINVYRKHSKFKDELFFTIDGKDMRGRSNAHTWEKIQKFIDMDHISFTNCAVFGQSVAQYFSALTDSQQKAVIEKIVGLSWCPKAYELSGDDVKKTQEEQGKLTLKLANLYEKSENINVNLKLYRENIYSFEVDKKKRIGELGNKIAKTEDTSEIEARIKIKVNEVFVADKKLEDKNALTKQMEDLNSKMAEFIVTIRIKTAEKKKAQDKIKSLALVKSDDTCEMCGQSIGLITAELYSQHLTEHIKVLDDLLATLEMNVDQVNDEKQPVIRQRDNLLEIEKELKTLNLELQGLRSVLTTMQVKNAKTDEFNQGIMKRIEEVEKEVSPYESLIAKLEQELAVVESERTEKKKEFEVIQNELTYREFLVELFSNRGYKSFVIESVLPDADRFASIYSQVLGGKYQIRFSPTTSLKGGEIREKFNVEVFNKYGSDVYEGNSSGEKRAVDSIVMFVLGDLAASRLNKRVALLILDDIFEKLDDAVCESIVKVLRMMITPRESRDAEYKDLPERESIFVLTHLDQFKESFENKMLVSRDHQGFTEIQNEGG